MFYPVGYANGCCKYSVYRSLIVILSGGGSYD